MQQQRIIYTIVLAFVVGVAVMIAIERFKDASGQHTVQKKPLYWIDSMEPTIHYPGPGKSRMGMDLVPIYPETNSEQSTVKISPNVINNLGVRIAPVEKRTFARRIETVGYIEPNENRIVHIHTYADGWIKRLFVRAQGDVVKKDQLLFQLYSPMLVNAQEEYLIAAETRNAPLIQAAQKKLQALNISNAQIQALKSTHKSSQLINVYAPQAGIVAQLGIREGMRVSPEMEIMSLVDLSTIWMIVEVFENEAAWVKVGQPVEAKLTAFPGKTLKGQVEYIYPQLDAKTRTLKARLRFANPENMLKPNMYANVVILANPQENVLSIPSEALIRSSDGNRVIVALGAGRFEACRVTIGHESGNRIEILSGLKVGEKVVISGQFLIDSESNLKASLERMDNKG